MEEGGAEKAAGPRYSWYSSATASAYASAVGRKESQQSVRDLNGELLIDLLSALCQER